MTGAILHKFNQLFMSILTSLFAPSLLRVLLAPRVEAEPSQPDADAAPSAD